MNKIYFCNFLNLLLFLFTFEENFTISVQLKCRMEDEPSDDELRKIIHTCVKRVFDTNQSDENFSNNAYQFNSNSTNHNSDANKSSWINSNNNNMNGNEDFDRIRNREHLQIRSFRNLDTTNLIQLKLNIGRRKYFTNMDDKFNNNQNRQQQQRQQQQQQEQQYREDQQRQQHQMHSYNNYNNDYNNDNYYQRQNGMDMNYNGNNGYPPIQQYDLNPMNERVHNKNNHNHDFNNNNSNDYDNNGQKEHNSHNNHNNNGNNGNWNYYLNKTNKLNTKQLEKKQQHDGACIVHCFFGELKMLNSDEYPDKRKVIQILTKDIKNNDLREFYTESVKECFHLIEVESKHRDKCEFAKTLINCMTDYARINCEDWDDKTIIF